MQGLRFVGGLPEVPDIRPQVIDLLQEHAAGDSAPDARRFVLRKIDAGDRAQDTEDDADVRLFFRLRRAGRGRPGLVHVRVTADPRQFMGDPCGGENEVGHRARALGHPGVLCGLLVLDERDTAFRLDRPKAERAVRARPRQHHADRAAF